FLTKYRDSVERRLAIGVRHRLTGHRRPGRAGTSAMRTVMAEAPDAPATRKPADTRSTEAAIDAGLMARVRRGDQDALTALYERHGTMVYSIALKFLRDPARAEDLTHDVFLVIWE